MLYLLHLGFLVNFLQTGTQQEKEVTWPRAPPFSIIVAGNSQAGASQIFIVAAALAFLHVLLGHQLPWMCITRGAENCFSQTCSWITCCLWYFQGDVLHGSPATSAVGLGMRALQFSVEDKEDKIFLAFVSRCGYFVVCLNLSGYIIKLKNPRWLWCCENAWSLYYSVCTMDKAVLI